MREKLDCRLDVPYGESPDEILGIFPANAEGAPVVVYVHGGAWTRWHKDHNRFQALPFVAAGATFVPVNFALVPDVTLDELVRQTYNGYYTNSRVIQLLGLEDRPPQPRGYQLEQGDFSVIEKVMKRGTIYREA